MPSTVEARAVSPASSRNSPAAPSRPLPHRRFGQPTPSSFLSRSPSQTLPLLYSLSAHQLLCSLFTPFEPSASHANTPSRHCQSRLQASIPTPLRPILQFPSPLASTRPHEASRRPADRLQELLRPEQASPRRFVSRRATSTWTSHHSASPRRQTPP